MSYDIGLLAREGQPLPSVEALDAFFRARPNYKVEESGYATYEHAPTAVRFGVEYGTHRDEEGWDPIRLTAPISGPHTRALELVEEVEAMVKAFDLLVNDGQMEGMGKGELDRDELTRGCLFASRFGYAVDIGIGRLTDDAVRLHDDGAMTAHWRWNRDRETTAKSVADDVFVPHVTYMANGKNTLSTVAWTGTMPFLLPEVDVIVTMDTSRGGATLKPVAVADLASALAAFPRRDTPTPHRAIRPTPGLMEAVAKAKAVASKVQSLSQSEVLGRTFWKATKDYYVVWSGGHNEASPQKPRKAKPKKRAAPKKKPRKTKTAAKATTKGKKSARASTKKRGKR